MRERKREKGGRKRERGRKGERKRGQQGRDRERESLERHAHVCVRACGGLPPRAASMCAYVCVCVWLPPRASSMCAYVCVCVVTAEGIQHVVPLGPLLVPRS